MDEIERRFNPSTGPNASEITTRIELRSNTATLARFYDQTLPEGREKSLALTKLEEALMWANAALAG